MSFKCLQNKDYIKEMVEAKTGRRLQYHINKIDGL